MDVAELLAAIFSVVLATRSEMADITVPKMAYAFPDDLGVLADPGQVRLSPETAASGGV